MFRVIGYKRLKVVDMFGVVCVIFIDVLELIFAQSFVEMIIELLFVVFIC